MKTKILTAVLLSSAVWTSGCAAMAGNGRGLSLNPFEIAARQEADEQKKKDDVARAEQQQKDAVARAEQKKKDEAAAADAKAKRAELEKLAATTQSLVIPELGITLKVPGDVKAAKHRNNNYGDPSILLSGDASGFDLILTNAEGDRYGLDERLKRQMSEYRYGMDVIRKENAPNGAWDFEYSYPIYYQDGTRGGTEMGYFSRKVISGKKINCLIAGTSEAGLGKVIDACKTVAMAK